MKQVLFLFLLALCLRGCCAQPTLDDVANALSSSDLTQGRALVSALKATFTQVCNFTDELRLVFHGQNSAGVMACPKTQFVYSSLVSPVIGQAAVDAYRVGSKFAAKWTALSNSFTGLCTTGDELRFFTPVPAQPARVEASRTC